MKLKNELTQNLPSDINILKTSPKPFSQFFRQYREKYFLEAKNGHNI
jgi:hypothetical protein